MRNANSANVDSDLSDNELGSIDDANFPSALQYLYVLLHS